jgi:hypothetical protein
MTPTELLHHLAGLDVRLAVNGDRLTIDAPAGTVSTALRQELAAHKAEILALLTESSTPFARHPCADRSKLRAELRQLAELLGWPELRIAQHIVVVAGAEGWSKFLDHGANHHGPALEAARAEVGQKQAALAAEHVVNMSAHRTPE